MKRILCLLLGIVLLLSLVVGCTAGSKTTNSSDGSKEQGTTAADQSSQNQDTTKKEDPKPVTITVFMPSDEDGKKEYEAWDATLKEKYPYITIKHDTWSYDVNSFLPKAVSGQLPSVFQSHMTETKKLADSGYVADLTDIMQKYGYDKALNPELLKLCMGTDGKYYSMPAGGYITGLWYNVNMMKEAGLVDDKGMPKFARTYEELAQMAVTIKEKTGKSGFFMSTIENCGGWQSMNIIWSFGGEFEKLVDGKWKAVFNSPEAVAGLQYIKDLKWKYDVLPENNLVGIGDMFRLFGTDQVAIAFAAPEWKNSVITQYGLNKDAIAMSVAPAGPKGQYGVLGGSVWAMSNTTTPEQQDACMKWLEMYGFTPKLSELNISDMEKNALANLKKGQVIVGLPYNIAPWIDPEYTRIMSGINSKYINVNIDFWNDYFINSAKVGRAEESMNCQDLYKIMDGVVQAVLTDKNSNPQVLLDKAVAEFQKDYLDKIN